MRAPPGHAVPLVIRKYNHSPELYYTGSLATNDVGHSWYHILVLFYTVLFGFISSIKMIEKKDNKLQLLERGGARSSFNRWRWIPITQTLQIQSLWSFVRVLRTQLLSTAISETRSAHNISPHCADLPALSQGNFLITKPNAHLSNPSEPITWLGGGAQLDPIFKGLYKEYQFCSQWQPVSSSLLP